MKLARLVRSLALLSLLLSACAGATQSAIQTGAAQTLDAELAAALAQAALQTAEAENAALQATNDALSTVNALAQSQPTQTQAPVFTATPQASTTRTLPPATLEPTHEPGIAAKFEAKKTCNGTPYALVLVRNVGPETYQSAIVKLSDSNGDEVRRSDGNNEFLTTASCPGDEQPTLGPGQERYVTVSLAGATPGDTYLIRVTVCTEKGYGGNCWSSTTTFVN